LQTAGTPSREADAASGEKRIEKPPSRPQNN
jgi:hypothetical protein